MPDPFSARERSLIDFAFNALAASVATTDSLLSFDEVVQQVARAEAPGEEYRGVTVAEIWALRKRLTGAPVPERTRFGSGGPDIAGEDDEEAWDDVDETLDLLSELTPEQRLIVFAAVAEIYCPDCGVELDEHADHDGPDIAGEDD